MKGVYSDWELLLAQLMTKLRKAEHCTLSFSFSVSFDGVEFG
jgi:hypothetical protein